MLDSSTSLDKSPKKYDVLRNKEQLARFREDYDCKHCIFYKKPKQCKANGSCHLEENPKKARKSKWQEIQVGNSRCEKDSIGNCPYGNEVGTCFNYCMKEILKEFRKQRKWRNEMEETKNE